MRNLPCEADGILGKNDALLPVTHVGGPSRGPTDSGGIWFYYAQGCSDLLWDVGRTMLVRNRAHAAIRIEQMIATRDADAARLSNSTNSFAPAMPRWHGGYAISEQEAAARVAAWIVKRHPRGWSPVARARGWAGLNATVEHVIAEAARGLYGVCTPPTFSTGGRLRPCRCIGSNSSKVVSSRRRLLALTPVCGDKSLSLHSEPLIRELPLDTLVLHKQPQGGGNPSWTTEIWDVRGSPALSRHLENATAHPEVTSRARWAGPGNLMGATRKKAPFVTKERPSALALSASTSSVWPSVCEPSDTWYTCFACRGSRLETACNGTVAHYRAHGACHWQKLRKAKKGGVASLHEDALC